MSSTRFLLLAGAGGVAVALGLTFPLALHLRSAFLDDGTFDAFQFAWNLWWAGESLVRLHTNPLFTRYLYYPEGVPLLFHTGVLPLGVVSIPLQTACGLVCAQNILVIAAPALTVLFTGWLAREVTGDPCAAFAGGVVAAVNPFAVWVLPVLNLTCIYLMAAMFVVWWRLQQRRRAGYVAITLCVLAVLVFVSPEYATMVLALLALDTLYRLLVPTSWGQGLLWPRGTTAFWLLGGAALSALALAASSSPPVPPPLAQVELGSGYLAGFVTPPWLLKPYAPFWSVYYLGTAPLLLLPVASLCRRRQATFWLLALVFCTAMALGPRMHLFHPWYGGWSAPGPYELARRLIPLLAVSRAPYRWIAAAQMLLAVLTALGVAELRARCTARARAIATAGLVALVLGGSMLDTAGLRGTLVGAEIPAPYGLIRDDPDRAAVVELPSGLTAEGFAAFSSLYMYYQTSHHKYLLEGTLARLPPDRQLGPQAPLTDFALLPFVKYVIVHHELIPLAPPLMRRYVDRLVGLLRVQGAPVVAGSGVTIYRMRTFRPESVR